MDNGLIGLAAVAAPVGGWLLFKFLDNIAGAYVERLWFTRIDRVTKNAEEALRELEEQCAEMRQLKRPVEDLLTENDRLLTENIRLRVALSESQDRPIPATANEFERA